jgi:hypothetical protein
LGIQKGKKHALSQFLATKDIQRMRIPATFAIETSKKADIDAVRCGFELPTNSNTVTH